MNEYKQQYDRVRRWFSRLTNQYRSQLDYEDFLWAFFQNCWHLKDWIKYDVTIPENIRDAIEREVEHSKYLGIVADLANRSKHLTLDRNIHEDAKHTKTDVTVHLPCLHLHLDLGPGEPQTTETTVGECRSEYSYTIETKDGSEYDAAEIAEKAIADWDAIIKKLNI